MPPKRVRKRRRSKRRQQFTPTASVELERFTSSDLRTWQRTSENLEKYHVQLFYHLQGLRALFREALCKALWFPAPCKISLENWVRIIDYKYSLQPLAATGSLISGGRFNIGNDLDPSKFHTFPALYLAESYDTAYGERFGLPPQPSTEIQGHEFALRKPHSFTAVNVSGEIFNIFDLRLLASLKPFADIIRKFDIPKELEELGRSLGYKGPLLIRDACQLKKTLLAQDWRMYPTQYGIPANPQVFGQLVLDAGFDGIVYRSTKGPKNCMALFPTNFAKSDSHVELADIPPPGAIKTRLDATSWRSIAEPPRR